MSSVDEQQVKEVGEPTSRIVVGRDRSRLRVREPQLLASRVLALIGVAFAVVGVTDLVLLWTPSQFGSAAWEFGTLSRTFDSIPMTGLGIGLVAYGLMHRQRSLGATVRALSVLFGLVAIILIVLGVMYATVVPAVVQQSQPEALGSIEMAVIKNVVEIVTYPLILIWITVLLWRGAEPSV